jgi:hypothetical protein
MHTPRRRMLTPHGGSWQAVLAAFSILGGLHIHGGTCVVASCPATRREGVLQELQPQPPPAGDIVTV